MSRVVKCPNCGAEVTFTVADSLVAVCRYCRAAVGRGDFDPESLGQLAEVADLGTRLAVGQRGAREGRGYTIVGRAQREQQSGARWDEWYLRFDEGQWGWLAEIGGGRYQLMFAAALPASPPPPAFAALTVGSPVAGLSVVEKGEAQLIAAEGELPFRPRLGAPTPYADLTGPHAQCGTLDFEPDPPQLYTGRELPREVLGLPADAAVRAPAARKAAAVELKCPQCGGALPLRAPDDTQRIGCAFCGALLDLNKGNLRHLATLRLPGQPPLLALGATGTLRGTAYTVLGAVRRHITGTVEYPWCEYVLHGPDAGWRYLAESDGHFTLFKPIPPRGELAPTIEYEGRTFRQFQHGMAEVDWVIGELPWRMEAGESVGTYDLIAPPYLLATERSLGDEVNWSVGEYIASAEVARAFAVTPLPASGIAPNQPNPYARQAGRFFLFVVLLGLLGLAVHFSRERRQVFTQRFEDLCVKQGPPSAGSASAEPTVSNVVFTDPFELHGGQDVDVSVWAYLDDGWVTVAGDFVNDETGLVQPFEVPVEYYHGVESGESWAEGSPAAAATLPALPRGRYTLRLECQTEAPKPITVAVTVTNGHFPGALFGLALGVLLAWWVGLVLRANGFINRRWSNADYPRPQSANWESL